MAWVFVVVAGLIEVAWAASLKQSEGFSRLGPSVVTVLLMIVSFAMLGAAMRTLPLGTAYAVWTGIGTVGTAIVGIVLFEDAVDARRLVCLALIAGGIVGLKLVGNDG